MGGEFGIALLTLLLQNEAIDPAIAQPLLVAVVLGMVLAPVILANNKRVARLLLGERGPPKTAIEREDAATLAVAKREHVILCGFGRVGQNVARVLEAQGFEYIAIDLDAVRVRAARQIGQPVVYGDSADEQVLEEVGLANANAVVISFSDTRTSLAILRSLRRLRTDVPVLVRTPDDSRLLELKAAGATEVVPEAFEASLMLASHVLMSLKVPPARVMRSVAELRGNRYEMLRNVIARGDGMSNDAEFAEQMRSVVLPPGSWCIGKCVDEVRARRRRGRIHRHPPPGHPRPRAHRGYGIPGRRHRGDLRHARGARTCRSGVAGGLGGRSARLADGLRFFNQLADFRYSFVAASAFHAPARFLCQLHVHRANALELMLFEFFEIHEHVVRAGRDAQQLVELDLHGLGVAVLRALDEEHHEEGDDGGAGVDHELPGVAEVEERAAHGPYHDNSERQREGRGPAGGVRRRPWRSA